MLGSFCKSKLKVSMKKWKILKNHSKIQSGSASFPILKVVQKSTFYILDKK